MNNKQLDDKQLWNRRSFLSLAATASAVGAVSTVETASAASGQTGLKKAVKIGMVRIKGSLLDKFQLLKKLGFDGVELDSPNNLTLDDVLKARDESGLTIHGVVDSIHWQKTLSHPDPAVRAEGLAGLKTAIGDAKAYGATSVLLVPGKCDEQATYGQAWKRSQQEIRKALPLAEETGIQVLMENVWNDFLTSPQETARFIDELESEMVGAYFDVGNSVRYSPPACWIPVLGKRIKKIDIKEYSTKLVTQGNVYKGFGVKLLEGECNWPLVMEELRKINYQSWGTAEIPGGGEQRLREIAQRMDRIIAS